ncbi:MAG: hypothetical protein A2W90_21190 [Bacteroidetes bacterium GWF2_42_66]|nr:MAG: hypothetical protein A2W89_03870 [Bacteroidetes bacterium GWE2_42_39]OFY40644.1 MAG: hypothetical protein A2W90_21190 [Bacteroidetes bacterium GWF2_42_66]HBL76599.1 hypothetical protein [Prolixibacteraceae bacterium]HCU61246.1 hypothetical protein [Prolixibacteraceae bacterium]
MEKNINHNEEFIVSYLHDREDTQDDIPADLKNTREFKQSETIFRLRKNVAFLNSLSPEDRFWGRINSGIRPVKRLSNWIKYAAIVVLSFTIGSLLIYFSGITRYDAELASISSPRGQITSLTLFDGTTVWLNSETTIKYSSAFNKKEREVFVEGEAYFEVAHNDKIPFIVNLGNSKVKVHGTTFNVKAYPSDNYIEAVLIEGKIEFIANNRSAVLNPSEKIILLTENGSISTGLADVEKTSAWKKGKYYYSNEKLSSIIEQIQRWYDTEFIFNEDELSHFTFTGVVNREKSIEYNLKIIELTNKIKFESKDGAIIITRKE